VLTGALTFFRPRGRCRFVALAPRRRGTILLRPRPDVEIDGVITLFAGLPRRHVPSPRETRGIDGSCCGLRGGYWLDFAYPATVSFAGFASALGPVKSASSGRLIAAWRVGVVICAPRRSVT